jgi:uncharacterized phage protein (predicted DNA packaging)
LEIVTLAEIKLYLRLDDTDTTEDLLLQNLIDSATEFIKNATGFTFATTVPDMATLIAKFMVAHWYENRQIVDSKALYQVQFTVDALLNQLKYAHTEEAV